MANNFRLAVAKRNSMCDDLVDFIDVAGPGTLEFRTGAQPATPDTAASGTLLATLTFSATAFGAASTGTATANAITSDTSADATGTAGYFRILNGTPDPVADGECGTAGSGDINFNTLSWTAGDEVQVTSLTVTVPLQCS